MKAILQIRLSYAWLTMCMFLFCISVAAKSTVITSSVLSPANGSMAVSPVNLQITALAIKGDSLYTIVISTSGTFANIVKKQTGSNVQIFNGLGYGTKYYVRVSVDGGATYGMATSFTTTTAIPTIISPENGIKNVSPASVSVQCSSIPGANIYTFQLSLTSTFSSIFKTISDSSTTQTFKDLDYGTKYYVRAKTDLKKNDSTQYGYGTARYFTTFTPTVISPVKAIADLVPDSIIIQTNTISGADSYTIQISTSSTFASIFQEHKGSNTQVFTDLAYGTRYFVRASTNLKKSDGSTYSGFGPISNFNTVTPYVTSPVNTAVGVNPASVSITSKALSGNFIYTIELSTDTRFLTNFVSNESSNNTILFSSLLPNTKYFARVKTNLLKSNGVPYGYGKTTSFTTGVMPAAAPKNNNGGSVAARESSESNTNEVSPSKEFNLNVYPNPSKDSFKLIIESASQQNAELKIFDALGLQIHSSSHNTNELIEVGKDLKSGMYIIKVSTPSGMKSIKAIKE